VKWIGFGFDHARAAGFLPIASGALVGDHNANTMTTWILWPAEKFASAHFSQCMTNVDINILTLVKVVEPQVS
jgi:hypothetical protein